MTDDEPEPESELFVTDVVPNGGPETKAVVSNTRIKARDLTDEHVGRFLGGRDDRQGINFPVEITKVKHFNYGERPGVSVWMRTPALPDGTPARDERAHVPFDHEFELIELMAW
jgi:hypothetical protein